MARVAETPPANARWAAGSPSWRKRRNLTRKQFADLRGRSVSWVDKVEAGERGLSRPPTLERAAEVLSISAAARRAAATPWRWA
jgi:transcriptional regulator with XRE-family HTH domain